MKTTNDQATKLRREISTRTSLRAKLAPDLRARCERHATQRVAEGAGQQEIAKELGVSTMSVKRWLHRSSVPAMVPVRIVATAEAEIASGRLVVMTSGGLRIEGLDLDSVCTLIARVG